MLIAMICFPILDKAQSQNIMTSLKLTCITSYARADIDLGPQRASLRALSSTFAALHAEFGAACRSIASDASVREGLPRERNGGIRDWTSDSWSRVAR